MNQIISAPLIVLFSVLAYAPNALSASIGVGFGRTTEFLGSDDSTIIPIGEFEIPTPIGIFKNEQLGFQLDLVLSESWDTGPILRLNSGRNDSVSDDVIAALPEIKASAEAGWFIGSGFKLSSIGINSDFIVIGRLSAVTDVGDGHGGMLVNGSVGLVMPVSDDLRFIPSVAFNYADENYSQSFYGVDAADSSAELMSYTAGAGVESTQVALVGISKYNERWFFKGVFAFNMLQGDAAESTITARGSDTQLFTGITANYSF